MHINEDWRWPNGVSWHRLACLRLYDIRHIQACTAASPTSARLKTRNLANAKIALVVNRGATWRTSLKQCLVKLQKNDAHYVICGHSRSLKVTDFSTNWKPVFDFLLVNDANICRISRSFADSFSLLTVGCHSFNALLWGEPWEYK